ncbi:MAG: TMEM175 family protein [Ramlibacter sp.]
METNRLEAFSDGVLAVIITIMVLELKVPHGASLEVLAPLWTVFLSYVLSFVYIGIYWNNHHHMLKVVKTISGGAMWANLHLLFWLSLVPFTTGWMGENHFERAPTIVYGFNMLFCALAYTILQQTLVRSEGRDHSLAKATRGDFKGKASLALYAAGIVAAWATVPTAGLAFFVAVALIWFVPDRRIERVIAKD